MAGAESLTWQEFWKVIREIGGHAERIEDKTRSGVPDVVWTWGRRSGWIELKAIGDDGDLGVRPSQAMFLRRWAKAKGNAGILARATLVEEKWYFWPASSTLAWATVMTRNPFSLPFVALQGPLTAEWLRRIMTRGCL